MISAGVMRLEDLLRDQFAGTRPDVAALFSHEQYWVALFGRPGTEHPWGWQFDGHHLAINITAVGGDTSVSPMFFGAEPDIVFEGPYAGWQVFGAERANGVTLAASLTEAQRRKAVLAAETPRDILAGPGRADALTGFEGIPASELTAGAQRAKIERDGEAELFFAWMGPIDADSNVYYRVHGPSVLIEYDNTGGRPTGPGNSNHVHLILRDPSDDFGEDLLARHYREAEHHRQHSQ